SRLCLLRTHPREPAGRLLRLPPMQQHHAGVYFQHQNQLPRQLEQRKNCRKIQKPKSPLFRLPRGQLLLPPNLTRQVPSTCSLCWGVRAAFEAEFVQMVLMDVHQLDTHTHTGWVSSFHMKGTYKNQDVMLGCGCGGIKGRGRKPASQSSGALGGQTRRIASCFPHSPWCVSGCGKPWTPVQLVIDKGQS
ncbi:mCG145049, partial [Mus musculus]